jgi:hypothetical protein
MRKIASAARAILLALATALLPAATHAQASALVEVLIASNSDDATLSGLTGAVATLGGSVFYNYASLRMIAATVPASAVASLAARSDVASISPNRAVARTASQLQLTTGAANASAPAIRNLDGSGVGIAIVDSGIGYTHQSVSTTTFLGSRARRACGRRWT